MDAFEILALIFAILVCLATIPNILVILGFYGWVIYLAWIATIVDIVSSIIIMVGACTPLSAGSYKVCMSFLIFGDVVALINIIENIILTIYFIDFIELPFFYFNIYYLIFF